MSTYQSVHLLKTPCWKYAKPASAAPLPGSRFAYVHVARGKISVNGKRLSEGDGLKVLGEKVLNLSSGIDAEVLVFELRARETAGKN